MNECVKNCEFLEFKNGYFYCRFYESDLKTELDLNSIILYKCEKCLEEGKIVPNILYLSSIKVKKQLSWIMDSFYSFKDEFEENITEIYKVLRKIEDEHERLDEN